MANSSERRKIKVASVAGWRTAGNGKLLDFVGEDRVAYETCDDSLGALVTVGAELEADVVFSEKTAANGQVYHHNTIVQLYAGGQPVKQKQSAGARQAAADSPEKLASSEDRVRARIIADLWIAGKAEDSMVTDLLHWLSKWRDSAVDKPQLQPNPKPATTAPPPSQVGGTDAGFKSLGEFLSACLRDLGLNRTQVLAEYPLKELAKLDWGSEYAKLAKKYAGARG